MFVYIGAKVYYILTLVPFLLKKIPSKVDWIFLHYMQITNTFCTLLYVKVIC